jgi:hypothetical protein
VRSGPQAFRIDDDIVRALRNALPAVAADTVAAVMQEVPGYGDGLSGSMGADIESAVRMAIGGFLKLAGGDRNDADPSTPRGPTLEGAYALGRGEARSGRSMDALLAAYRVGARVSWRGLARTAADAGLPAAMMAEFAELLFAYIDELSATSAGGYHDELTTSGRVRERYRERLGQRLLAGAAAPALSAAAERAEWAPPDSLTAVLLPASQVPGVLALMSPDTLVVTEDLPGLDDRDVGHPPAVLLVPDVTGSDRRHLRRILGQRQAVIGPARPWLQARSSYDRAVRTASLLRSTPAAGSPRAGSSQFGSSQFGSSQGSVAESGPVDSEDHLVDLVVGADPEALADLRRRALAPLADLPEASRDRLVATLRSWLLHQGRRDEVAAELHVHPQTVRYRMGQLRELYGDRLDDPQTVLALTLALA